MDIEKERGRLRRQAALAIIYDVYPAPMGEGLIAKLMGDDLQANRTNLRRAVDYLAKRGLVDIDNQSGTWLARITPDGIDVREAVMPAVQREQLRLLRLRVLQALDWGRPQRIGTNLIRRALLADEDLDLDDHNIRRAISYLAGRNMASHDEHYISGILPDGVDYIADDGEDCPGIRRPTEY